MFNPSFNILNIRTQSMRVTHEENKWYDNKSFVLMENFYIKRLEIFL